MFYDEHLSLENIQNLGAKLVPQNPWILFFNCGIIDIKLFSFQVYNIMIQYLCALQNDHNKSNFCHCM